MEYINVPLYVARSSEYVGAEPVQRATWFSLMAWSCDQENMGRITGARYWGDRRWMQTCGVMASEVAESCGLFHWDGDDLIVTFYPEDAQREIERKREIARVNGRKGGRKAKRKEKKRKERKEKWKKIIHPPLSPLRALWKKSKPIFGLRLLRAGCV